MNHLEFRFSFFHFYWLSFLATIYFVHFCVGSEIQKFNSADKFRFIVFFFDSLARVDEFSSVIHDNNFCQFIFDRYKHYIRYAYIQRFECNYYDYYLLLFWICRRRCEAIYVRVVCSRSYVCLKYVCVCESVCAIYSLDVEIGVKRRRKRVNFRWYSIVWIRPSVCLSVCL